MNTLFDSSVRIARKKYRCIWCGERIQKGDNYVRETGVNDGDFFAQKYHPECKTRFLEVADANGDGGWMEFEAYGEQRPISTLNERGQAK